MTAKPSRDSLLATTRPIPREAPVTMTLLVKSSVTSRSPEVQGYSGGASDEESPYACNL
ncbi:MAG: hypothetical protein WCA39_12560 [Nitrososphaeraceae archaeon]